MRGRVWLVGGAAVGIAVSAGHLPFLAGAGKSLADTVVHLVATASSTLVRDLSAAGASKRVVLGISGAIAAVLPGITALGLVYAARSTLRVRTLVSLGIVVLGAIGYAYHPGGIATGTLALVLAVASATVALSGPAVVAPLTALAGLIGGEYLPKLLYQGEVATHLSVEQIHQAIWNSPGTPLALRFAVLLLAALPFALAARLVLWR